MSPPKHSQKQIIYPSEYTTTSTIPDEVVADSYNIRTFLSARMAVPDKVRRAFFTRICPEGSTKGNNLKPQTKDTHVVIVGAGPVGMMCASKLSNAGIKVTVFEKVSQSVSPSPQACLSWGRNPPLSDNAVTQDAEIDPRPKALTYT